MAPLAQAIDSEFAYDSGEKIVFRGQVDGEWTVMSYVCTVLMLL